MDKKYNGLEVAIVGMSCQLPGSKGYPEFWENLITGKDVLTQFTDDELLARGVPASHRVRAQGDRHHCARWRAVLRSGNARRIRPASGTMVRTACRRRRGCGRGLELGDLTAPGILRGTSAGNARSYLEISDVPD